MSQLIPRGGVKGIISANKMTSSLDKWILRVMGGQTDRLLDD